MCVCVCVYLGGESKQTRDCAYWDTKDDDIKVLSPYGVRLSMHSDFLGQTVLV